MSFLVQAPDSVYADLGALPKQVRKKVQNSFEYLRTAPTEHSTVKKLTGYRDLWRMRLGDYRMVYQVNASEKSVKVLLVGKRGDVYERMGGRLGAEGPSIQLVAARSDLLDPEPTPAEIGKASIELANMAPPEHSPETLLPVEITTTQLSEWGIPAPFHESLDGVRTEEQLLAVEGIPQDWHERVMHLALAMPIEEVIERPTVPVRDQAAFQSAVEGERSLASFLLELDRDQQTLLDRFLRNPDQGPWLVKGGPGTGKTIVSLYAIQALLTAPDNPENAPRILFTTYTRALASAAKQLLLHLGIDPDAGTVDVINIDALARQVDPNSTPVTAPGNQPYQQAFEAALKSCVRNDRSFPFSLKDQRLLQDEIEWVITGRGICRRKEYLNADRTGRVHDLDRNAREAIWKFYFAFRSELESIHRRTFEDVLGSAAEHAQPTYDYVFVDEVHDLKSIALTLASRLARQEERVFLTLDPNQSIYGSRQGWAEDLPHSMSTPRTAVLRTNHRSTSEIWLASREILRDQEVLDPETVPIEGPLSGPSPRLVGISSEDETSTISEFIHSSLIEERATLGCAAILCSTLRDCHSIAKALPTRLRARVMESKDLDLDHNGVKVLTMHAAKGLQFPVVVIARMSHGRFPLKAEQGIPLEVHMQHAKRLLFVACSRAMRRLMVLHLEGKPSPTLSGLADGSWAVRP